MGLKATLLDDENTPHLLIGLNRKSWNRSSAARSSGCRQARNVPLTEKSDIVIIFEETDEQLVESA
jgi:hypothetical protein